MAYSHATKIIQCAFVILVVQVSNSLTSRVPRQSCICTKIYLPVCGSDNTTYSNECTFKCAKDEKGSSISIAYEGECKEKDDEDPCICNRDYQPVCGSDLKTYNNECLLKCANAENVKKGEPSITIGSNGECQDKNKDENSCICPFVYQPICGSDMVTYNNECLLKCANNENTKKGKSTINLLYEGRCNDQNQEEKEDSCICPFIYQRVCGSDMVTYGNKCVLKCANKKNIKNGKPPITIAYEGQCKDEDNGQHSCICPFVYRPVCGSDMNTYDNECLLNCASDKNVKKGESPVKLNYDGECKEPEKEKESCVCPFVYDPVCGSDMVTYNNKCLLKCANDINIDNGNPSVKLAYEGKCNKKNEDQDICVCPSIYQPVCGTDKITYNNVCLLRCANNVSVRQGKSPISISYDGQCYNGYEEQFSCLCTSFYQPVCGSDNITYVNECFIQCANKKNGDAKKSLIKVEHEGECKTEETCTCPDVYQPMCGADGVTYKNDCELNCKNREQEKNGARIINIVSNGKCPEGCVCVDVYDPVCGSDGKTYPNECELSCLNRKQESNGEPHVQYLYPGICKQACNCSNDNEPVCGSDGQTYRNICEMNCESKNLEEAGLSPISLYSKGQCQYPCYCPNTIQAFCGSDNKTYKNYCVLDCINKNLVRPYTPYYAGKSYTGYNIGNYDAYNYDVNNAYKSILYPYGPQYGSYSYEGISHGRYLRDTTTTDDDDTGDRDEKNNEQSQGNKKDEQNQNNVKGASGDGNNKDNINTNTFIDNRLASPISVRYFGRCRECSCYDINSPVCGSDGVTYQNECKLNCKNEANKNFDTRIFIVHLGECAKQNNLKNNILK